MSPRTELLVAIAAVVVLATPGLSGDGVDFPDDALYYGVTSWEWLRHAVRAGEPIWWVPGKLGGVSLYGDVMPMGPLYPFAWLGVLLPVIPAMGLAVLVHAVGTLLAVRWLARLHGASPTASTLAGAAVVLGPLGSAAFVDFQVDSWPAFLWLPVVLACLESSNRGAHRTRWLAGAAVALGLLLLGTHLRVAVGACGVIGVWTLLQGRNVGGAVLACGAGLLIGAPGFVPMLLEAAASAADGATRPGLDAPIDQALGLHALGGWLAPTVMSHARDISLGGVLGVATLLGLAVDRRAGAAVLILVLAGTHLPGVRWAFAPLLMLSHPVNLVWPVLALIPAAVLAAIGLDRLIALTSEQRRALLNGPVGIAIGLLLAARVLLSDAPTVPVVLALAAIGGALAAIARGRRDLLFAVVVAELLSFGVRAQVAIPSTPLEASADAFAGDPALVADGYLDLGELADGFDSVLTGGDAASVEELAAFENELDGAGPDGDEDELDDPRAAGPAMQAALLERTWPPHLGMALGVRGLAGRSKLMPDRQVAALRPLAEALHDNRGIEYFLPQLFGESTGLGATTLALHGIPVAVWRDVATFRVEQVAPLCYLALRTAIEPAPNARIARLLASDGRFDARAALLETPPAPPLPARVVPAEHLSCAEPGITDISTSTGGLVVRRERWHPGWQVLDQTGRVLRSFPVNQVHTGVVVGPGTTRLTYRFVPPGLPGALRASAVGWFLVLGALAWSRRRTTLVPVVAALGLLLPAAAGAAPISGTVEAWNEQAEYEVLLTDTLDLTLPPLARADVAPTTGTFRVTPPAGATGDGWLFLHQRVEPAVGPPIRLYLPLDLDPFDLAAPPDHVRVRGVSPMMAELRASGEPLPGWWLMPVVLCLWVYLFALLGRGAVQWRLHMVAGARAILGAIRQAPEAEANLLEIDANVAPRAHQTPPPPSPRERAALGVALAVGLGLRLRGMFGSSFDLLEHTYGPGSRPLDAVPLSGLELLTEMLLRPSAVEVTHPPVYHWILGLLGFISPAEWFLRLPALAASLATIAVVWMLFRRINPAAGGLGALLYATVAPAVHFGADATPYALSALIAVGSLELMLRALQSGATRDWRRWVGALAFGFLCHYSVALFGLAQAGALVVLCLIRGRRPAWLGALHRALGAVLLLAPLPLAWCFVHFAWYDPVALDTRLFASTYAKDPGLLSFAAQFGAVSVGVPPTAQLAAGAFAILVGAGLVRSIKRDRELGLLLLASTAAFAGGTLFFHQNLVAALDGRVFWGFRWVSWVLPLAMGLAAVGLAEAFQHRVSAAVAVALAALWGWSAIPFVVTLPEHSTRPDYEAAAERMATELQDRDAIATLPLWGQRGPLTWYLSRAGTSGFREVSDGVDGWFIDGKRVFAEATFEDLPLETSANNAWFERIWIVIVDEKVFGKPKFSLGPAARTVAWAREHLILETEWSVDGLTIYAFAVSPEPPGEVRITPPELGLEALPWLEPNMPGCREGEEGGRGTHWRLNARVPLRPGAGQPRVEAHDAAVQRRDDPGHWTATILGGPCSGPPPVVQLRSPK